MCLIRDCLQILPEDIVIHRLTGDGPKSLLLAPAWSADKKRVINTMRKWISDDKVENEKTDSTGKDIY